MKCVCGLLSIVTELVHQNLPRNVMPLLALPSYLKQMQGFIILAGLTYTFANPMEVPVSVNDNWQGTRASDSLRLIVVVSRHGNRGGFQDYPQDPYPVNNTWFWPNGPQQLTPHGMVQEYNLGRKLRSLYYGFLPNTSYSAGVFAESDMSKRVIISGKLVLAGMFPLAGSAPSSGNQEVLWQPIAIYTNDDDHSTLLYGTTTSCSQYQEDKQEVSSNFFNDNAEFISQLSDYVFRNTGVNLGVNLTAMYQLFYIIDKAMTEDTEGYTLPEWIENIFPEPLTDFYSKMFIALLYGKDEEVRLSVGNIFQEVVENLKIKVNGTLLPNRKVYYISGHDTTVLGFELALGIPRSSLTKVVNVGSALSIELHQDSRSGDYFIKVVYIDGSNLDMDPTILSLPDCGDPCDFNNFLNSTQRFTNVNYEEECNTTNGSSR